MKQQNVFFVFCWILVACFSVQAQLSPVDSLSLLLNDLGPNRGRVDVLNILSDKIRRKDNAKALAYAEEAASLAQQLSYREGLGLAFIRKGSAYSNLSFPDSTEKYLQLGLTMAEQEDSDQLRAWALFKLGEEYVFRYRLEEADSLLNIAQNLFVSLPDPGPSEKDGLVWLFNAKGLMFAFQNQFEESKLHFKTQRELAQRERIPTAEAAALGNLGINFRRQGLYDSALIHYFQALEIDERIGNRKGLSANYLNVGNIYEAWGEYDKAREYFLASLEMARAIDFKRNIGNCLNVLGELSMSEGDYDQALIYINESLVVKKEIGNERAYSNSLWNKAKLFQLQEKYTEAFEVIEECIQVRERLKTKDGLSGIYFLQGETYQKMGQPNKALSPLNKSMDLAQEIGSYPRQRQAASVLAKTYEELGNFKQAYEFQQLYTQVNDSLITEAKIKKERELEARYDFEKNRAAIAQLEKEKALQTATLQEERQSRQFILGIGLLLLVLGLGGFAFYRVREQKSERERELVREREQLERLRQIDKLKDQFLANTSHELRTPLHGIIGIAETLQEKIEDGDQQQNLGMLVASGKRLSSLVNDLLDFSRIKNRDLELHTKALDMYSLVALVLKTCEPLIQGKELILTNAISPQSPSVYADENRIQQVLYNLIGNAIKFTERGEISVGTGHAQSLPKTDGLLTLYVQDSGIGIPEEKREIIFQEFEQGDGSISKEFAGTGLGLSISKFLIEQHGGELWVESEIEKGSTFFFTLPKATRELSSNMAPTSISNPNPQIALAGQTSVLTEKVSVAPSGSVRILIVDDEPINHTVLQNYLQTDGYLLESAMNGIDALKRIESEPPYDLILLDVMMPRMSGYDLCKKIRKSYLASELPILMLTAKNQVSDMVRGLDTGANDYLAKPFSRDEFRARVKTHIGLHRIHQATRKFVPHEFIRALGRDTITEVELGDQIEKEVTIFFSDIRDYTSLAEKLSPSETFSLVNTYAYRLGPIIRSKSGFVTDYLGDGIVALFPEKVDEALEAAIAMQKAITQLNTEKKPYNSLPIKVGMGLHTGPLVMGIIGDEERNDAATISDAVNTASRIEGLTKHFGTPILFSGETLLRMQRPDDFAYRYLGQFLLKGKKSSVAIYEALDALPAPQKERKIASQGAFEKGLKNYFNQHFYEAIEAFNEVLLHDPQDIPCLRMKDKALQLLTDGVPPEWNGIEVLGSK